MGKVNCPCGNQLSDVSDPSRNKGWMLKDIDVKDGYNNIISDGVDLWECGDCGRVAFGNNTDNTVKWFKPESGKYEKLCHFE